ncbi:MAG TPA: phosphopantetheine-binding protein [Myxococcota bacterium]|nr:phosphopantetheine-binding protein [Myxococcota bacterium]HRY97146.1 phosphopantetheine-binding protein [Myxococcota bacterium]HSA21388.1 phosphopantetheine-binding protein [Myxococcota bacterium]
MPAETRAPLPELPAGLIGLVAEILGCAPGDVRPEVQLRDGLGADSLALALLADALEARLGWVVPDLALDRLVTVADVLALSGPRGAHGA